MNSAVSIDVTLGFLAKLAGTSYLNFLFWKPLPQRCLREVHRGSPLAKPADQFRGMDAGGRAGNRIGI
jgi:hypothetical protein